MTIDTKTMISVSEANQNFSKVAKLDGIELKYTQKELYETILDVAVGKMEYEDLLQWVLVHQNKIV